jgi:preprotein translocase subunit SecY
MGLQKMLIFVMIIVEAAPNLVGGFTQPDPAIAQSLFGGNAFAVSFLIFVQLCIGGVLIFLRNSPSIKF